MLPVAPAPAGPVAAASPPAGSCVTASQADPADQAAPSRPRPVAPRRRLPAWSWSTAFPGPAWCVASVARPSARSRRLVSARPGSPDQSPGTAKCPRRRRPLGRVCRRLAIAHADAAHRATVLSRVGWVLFGHSPGFPAVCHNRQIRPTLPADIPLVCRLRQTRQIFPANMLPICHNRRTGYVSTAPRGTAASVTGSRPSQPAMPTILGHTFPRLGRPGPGLSRPPVSVT
jgi:hypothetical protein